jgi:DNA-binding winged helix-turn-helix (wHTH) protein
MKLTARAKMVTRSLLNSPVQLSRSRGQRSTKYLRPERSGTLNNIFRFAHFEAGRERYQLRRGTRAIKLERIPLEILFLLLERSNKLVAREEIVARLWGDNVLLDTERSINTAVRKIRRALEDDSRHPQFIETIVGKGYRFIASLIPVTEIRSLHPEIQSSLPSVADGTNREGSEIRLQGFLVEAADGRAIITCDVMVSNITLGRLPLLEVELPVDVTLPLRPEDRLLLKLHGVRVTLTDKAAQALHAFSISVLQSGLRTRVTDSLRLSEEALEKLSPADTHPKNVGFSALGRSDSAATQQRS